MPPWSSEGIDPREKMMMAGWPLERSADERGMYVKKSVFEVTFPPSSDTFWLPSFIETSSCCG
jgi:hypothetical protein